MFTFTDSNIIAAFNVNSLDSFIKINRHDYHCVICIPEKKSQPLFVFLCAFKEFCMGCTVK